MQPPIFIMCSGRSGSSLLAGMLSMHPSIFVPPELWSLFSLERKARVCGDLREPFSLDLFLSDSRLGSLGELELLEYSFSEPLFRELALTGTGRFVETFYETLLRPTGKRRLCDKTPAHVSHLPVIARAFPESPVIHLVRDGRDCAVSYLTGFGDGAFTHGRNVYEVAAYYRDTNEALMAFGRANPDRYHLVRYEDLVARPVATLESLCAFLNEPFMERLLQHTEGRYSRTKASRQAHHSNLEHSLLRANTGKWRTSLSVDERAVWESVAGRCLARLGYEPCGERSGRRWRQLRRTQANLTLLLGGLRRARRGAKMLRFVLLTRAKRLLRINRFRDLWRPSSSRGYAS